jgi:cellulose synthase/poly-beta-1,6-N-acetylglucosamine synthase-like glycosyltransferase
MALCSPSLLGETALFLLGTGSLFYAEIDRRLLKGLSRLRFGRATERPKVTILVSARNEERQIEGCLASLSAQDYPSELLEIRIADDRSTDSTRALIEAAHARDSRIHLHAIESCPPGRSPKKSALKSMIAEATGELLLTTDADCRVPTTWVSRMVAEFEPGVELVAGHSRFPGSPEGTFAGSQALEFLSHSIVSAGSIVQRIPITCSGNNLAYRRSFFEAVGGFEGNLEILSGDDDFLLQKAFLHDRNCIRYCIHPESYVLTAPQESLEGLAQQRKRWASKTIHYSGPVVRLLSIVFAYYIAILAALVGGGVALAFGYRCGGTLLAIGFGGFLWKSGWDYAVMLRGAQIFGRQELLRWYPSTALAHMPLIVGSVIGGVTGRFRWKGASGRS